MYLLFYKYHNFGNDFIIIDNRNYKNILLTKEYIKKLCNRIYGIGSNGIIFIKKHYKYNLEMIYYNSDGNLGPMCGNGGLCTVHFAKAKKIIKYEINFKTFDGIHKGYVNDKNIKLKMSDVSYNNIKIINQNHIINTGSMHYVEYMNYLNIENVYKRSFYLKNTIFKKKMVNMNFYNTKNNIYNIITYECGVEDITYSCGTGCIATALSINLKSKNFSKKQISYNMINKGGNMIVNFRLKNTNNIAYDEIYITGNPILVYKGKIKI
ncbi:MAG: diaminopimelate epimerase [Bacteroides sp.]|nr:MAG: diaminopimelate epimerase [Bacteroides sp.]